MADLNEDLRRSDPSEVRFQDTVPGDKKYAATSQGIQSLPKGGQDEGIHIDKPTSVTAEAGYGGVSGRGNDISSIVEENRGHGSESFGDKAKDVATGVKDLASGKKQEEAAHPVVDQSPPVEHKEGVGSKVKDFVTGQKPGHGVNTADRTSGPYTDTPSATRTDPEGNPVEGPRDDTTKKEGLMAKVMDKLGKN